MDEKRRTPASDRPAGGEVDRGRRVFLKSLLAGTALIVTGRFLGGGVVEALAATREIDPHPLPRFEPKYPPGLGFPQSVASGDPTSSGAVLWTRVDPAVAEGISGDRYDPSLVQWLERSGSVSDRAVREAIEQGRFVMAEVAETPDFTEVLLRAYAPIWNDFDNVVKLDLDGHLAPRTTYYYRFVTKSGHVSRTGRFKTLPAEGADVSGVRFAYFSCQDYTNGYYHALRYAAEEEMDFFIHLGDYIYESVGDPAYQHPLPDREIRLPSGGTKAFTVEDYRTLYRTYRSDRDLQKLHEQHAMIAIWDDHEFANDCYYPAVAPDDSPEPNPDRRLAAHKVWFEYMPARVRFDPAADVMDSLRIYRSVRVGNLAEIILTDERLYRSAHPCGEGILNRYVTPGCAKMFDPKQTMLGAGVSDQREWFLNRVKTSPCLWKIWGNEVQITPLKILGLYLNLDAWDGFAGERKTIAEELKRAGVKNFIAITGDLHTFEAGLIKVDYLRDPDSAAIGVEFMGGSVTSSNLKEMVMRTVTGRISPSDPIPFGAVKRLVHRLAGPLTVLTDAVATQVFRELSLLVKAENPWIKLFDSATHGYCILELSHSKATWTAYSVDPIQSREAGKSLLFQAEVPRDEAKILIRKK